MGKCLSKTSSGDVPIKNSANKKQSTVKQFSFKNPQIEANKKSQFQGVHELKMNYLIEEKQIVLGSGAFGKVFLSESVHNKGIKVAIKALDKVKLSYDIQMLHSEVAILQKLDHPNIVKYLETYNDYKYIYLVMEYINGQQLIRYLSSHVQHSELRTCTLMKDIVSAIAHCHA